MRRIIVLSLIFVVVLLPLLGLIPLGFCSDPPTYSDISNTSTTAAENCTFSITWDDDVQLHTDMFGNEGGYIFSHNNTGAWVNGTWTKFESTPETVETEITLNSTVDMVLGYMWYANDTESLWNNTGIQTLTITSSSPTFSSITSNTTVANSGVVLNVTISDNAAVSHFIYSWNNTGSWVNQTTTAFSSNPCQHTGTWNDTIGNVVCVKVYANDTSDNWGVSSQYNFTLSTTFTINLQARDGTTSTNLPRAVTFSVTFPNSTTTDFTSNNSGLKIITSYYGNHTIVTKWGTHIVSSTTISITDNTTVQINTKIQRLNTGDNYLLVSLNNTDLSSPTLQGDADLFINDVTATGNLEFKVDHTYWKRTDQPSRFEVGTGQYNQGDETWSWANSVFSFTEDFLGTQDILLSWEEQGGVSSGGSSSSGSGSREETSPYLPDEGIIETWQEQPYAIPESKRVLTFEQGVLGIVAVFIVVGSVYVVKKARRKSTKQKYKALIDVPSTTSKKKYQKRLKVKPRKRKPRK